MENTRNDRYCTYKIYVFCTFDSLFNYLRTWSLFPKCFSFLLFHFLLSHLSNIISYRFLSYLSIHSFLLLLFFSIFSFLPYFSSLLFIFSFFPVFFSAFFSFTRSMHRRRIQRNHSVKEIRDVDKVKMKEMIRQKEMESDSTSKIMEILLSTVQRPAVLLQSVVRMFM